MKKISAALILSTAMALQSHAEKIHTFEKIQLSDEFWSEGANIGDFNHDGKMDIVSGPFWYEGPDFKVRHEFAPATETFQVPQPDGTKKTYRGFEGGLGTKNSYSHNFFAYTYDINHDGWTDIVILGFPGEESWWFENPKGKDGHWAKHTIIKVTDNESPMLGDLTGHGKPELICSSEGYMGYASPEGKNPTNLWTFHRISENKHYHKFTHGLGIGDVNGDGRMDVLEKNGWYEQPKSLKGDPIWKFHSFEFSHNGSAQMFAYDVNGDGLPDVITSMWAHGYGLAWYEQLRERDSKGEIQFKKHLILNEDATPNKYGVAFSQLHGVAMADMNGDGLLDIVTGKRFWAHGHKGPDPDSDGTPVLYWFQLVRNRDKSVDWIPHQIDNNSGVGTQVVVGKINKDKLPDIVVGNKKGTFVFLHGVEKH
ncbi:MAG: FG-GAP repeat domain-containing protein [Limisphaerales bacterium]